MTHQIRAWSFTFYRRSSIALLLSVVTSELNNFHKEVVKLSYEVGRVPTPPYRLQLLLSDQKEKLLVNIRGLSINMAFLHVVNPMMVECLLRPRDPCRSSVVLVARRMRRNRLTFAAEIRRRSKNLEKVGSCINPSPPRCSRESLTVYAASWPIFLPRGWLFARYFLCL